MYVRLAFSVAAHLEPEILVVDEVLAVGDAAFQKKSLGRMQDVSKEGRTILFVSHNLSQIQKLCNKIIYLENGHIKAAGETESILHIYNQTFTLASISKWVNKSDTTVNEEITPLEIRLTDEKDMEISIINRKCTQKVFVSIKVDLHKEVKNLTLGYSLFNLENNYIYRSLYSDNIVDHDFVLKKGVYVFKSEIPLTFLNEGYYTLVLDASIYKKKWLFNPMVEQNISIAFEIQNRFAKSEYWQDKRSGIIAPLINWNIEMLGDQPL